MNLIFEAAYKRSFATDPAAIDAFEEILLFVAVEERLVDGNRFVHERRSCAWRCAASAALKRVLSESPA